MKNLFYQLFAALAVVCAAGAALAVPVVSNVTLERREGTSLVDVYYDLAGEAAIITLGIETNVVMMPDSALTVLSGDVSKTIQPGVQRKITWDAGAAWPAGAEATARARVVAWALSRPPLYCAVNLSAGPGASAYPVYYYPSAEAVPGGVTNDLYKSTWLLLRRIDPTPIWGFFMGSPSTEYGRLFYQIDNEIQTRTRLSQGYYIGIYEVTQKQWERVMGAYPSYFTAERDARPVEQVTYKDHIRGAVKTYTWPTTTAVDPNSFVGKIRARTGIESFDLPTEAQWEYACRAGTTGALNDDTLNLTNVYSDARLDLLGRYRRNGGHLKTGGGGYSEPAAHCGPTNGTAIVGSYLPNAWGLYDMHGNVYEWCLDGYAGNHKFPHVYLPEGGTDPKLSPVQEGSYSFVLGCVLRGGGYGQEAQYCRSASRYRGGITPSTGDPVIPARQVGLRLAIHLP